MKHIPLIISISILICISQIANSASIFDFLNPTKSNKQPSIEDQTIHNSFDPHQSPMAEDDYTSLGKANLIVIDKITATSQTIQVNVDKPVFFRNLEIMMHKCLKSNNVYKSDHYALLTLTEYKPNDDSSVIFQGWLIKSSPSISNFNNQIYELFIQECM